MNTVPKKTLLLISAAQISKLSLYEGLVWVGESYWPWKFIAQAHVLWLDSARQWCPVLEETPDQSMWCRSARQPTVPHWRHASSSQDLVARLHQKSKTKWNTKTTRNSKLQSCSLNVSKCFQSGSNYRIRPEGLVSGCPWHWKLPVGPMVQSLTVPSLEPEMRTELCTWRQVTDRLCPRSCSSFTSDFKSLANLEREMCETFGIQKVSGICSIWRQQSSHRLLAKSSDGPTPKTTKQPCGGCLVAKRSDARAQSDLRTVLY